MDKSKFQHFQAIEGGSLLEFTRGPGNFVVCPDTGGRTFAEVCGISVQRIALECVAKPDQRITDLGRGSFWPAPEGGRFAFNYLGNDVMVRTGMHQQAAI